MRNAKGFTLVELLIVIAIIAILAAVLIPNLSNARKKANAAAAQAFARQVATWLAAADASGQDVTGVTTCNDSKLQAEGAPAQLPKQVKTCSIAYNQNEGRFTITVTSINNDEFTVTY